MIRFLSAGGTRTLCLTALLLSACAGGQERSASAETWKGEATRALQEKLDGDPDLEALLAKSIAAAAALDPDTLTNPAQSVDRFLAYTERMETSLPWTLVPGDPSRPSANIFAALVGLYWVLDQPLPELEGKGLYRPTLQYYPPFAPWLTTFNDSWRRYLDSDASWNAEATRLVQGDPAFGLQNGWYEDPSHWKSFNQFFSRYLSSPAARPIASPDDDAVVASYADAVPMGTWAIDSASDIEDPDGVAIKSMTIRNVAKLLGDDSGYKDAFANGTLTHSFLDVTDYHRYHFPSAARSWKPASSRASTPREARSPGMPSNIAWSSIPRRWVGRRWRRAAV